MNIRGFIKKISKEAYVTPVVLSLFLVPLFWNPSFIYTFTQGKEILFKAIILCTLLILVPILIRKKKYNLKNIFKSAIFFLLLLQICVYAITNVFSNTPIVTLYGTYTRGFGFIIELFLFVFLIYCSLVLSEKNISRLLKVAFISGFIIAIYAVFQKMGFNPLFKNYDINIFAGRAFSFSGNPSYLGQIMLLDIVIGGFLVASEINRKKKIMYILGTLVLLSTLLLSGTRTALAGLAVALILLAIKYFRPIINVIKKHKLVIIVGLVAIGIAFASLPQERYSLSNIALRSLNSRFEIWKGTVDLIKEKPLLGYGEETFYIHFPEIITKKFLTLEEDINVSADRIHNETLEIFFSHGIFAVIIYLLLLILVIKIFFRSKNKMAIVLALLIIANAVQNQFAFPDISISILIAFCFGGLVALEVKDSNEKIIEFKKWKRYLMAVVAVCLVLYIGFIAIYKPYMSQLAYSASQKNYAVDYTVTVNKHKEALACTPYYSELWYDLMFIDPSSMERSLFMLEQIEGNSGNVLAWKGNFYADKDQQKASEFYAEALKKNPYHPNWIRAFADMLYEQGDYENALYLYNQYLEAIPDFWKWADNLETHTPKERASYETFLKHTPYFWGIIEKIDHIISVLGESTKK